MIKRLQSTVLLLVVLFGLGGCSSMKSFNPLSMLTGNSWVLNSLMGNKDIGSLFGSGGALPSLNFGEGGKLSGFSGCNNFTGNFKLDGTNLNLDPGAMTRKACPGDGESKFLGALKQVNSIKKAGKGFALMNGAQELMSFLPK